MLMQHVSAWQLSITHLNHPIGRQLAMALRDLHGFGLAA